MSAPSLLDAAVRSAFIAWLAGAGAKLRLSANTYELIRFEGPNGVSIIYRNDHGRPLRMNGDARAAWDAYREGRTIDLAPPVSLRAGATIFADASYCPRSHAAGWAAWIKTSRDPGIVVGGAIRAVCTSPQQAEIFALANGVAEAHAKGSLGGRGAIVSLQSDCTSALFAVLCHVPGAVERQHAEGARITGRHLITLTPGELEALDIILGCVCEDGVRVAVRHVRGHTDGGGRQWVNDRCDRLAKSHMNRRRAELNAQPWAPLPGEAPSPSIETQDAAQSCCR